MKTLIKIASVIVLMSILVACATPNQESSPTIATTHPTDTSLDKHMLEISSNENKFSFSAKEITDMASETLTVTSITSSSEVITSDITGIKLDVLLKPHNIEQRNFKEIRLFAADGYSIIVPTEIVSSKDIYIIWKYNNEPLQEPHYPIRAAIADERSMYWVYQLSGIELLLDEMSSSEAEEKPAVSTNKLVFMETAFTMLDALDYTYNDSIDKAVSVDSLLSRFNHSVNMNGVTIHAIDDFNKAEKSDIFKQGYIKYTGEDSPIFLAPGMPKWMQVINILCIKNVDTIYFNEKTAFAKYQNTFTGLLDMYGIPLNELENLTGFNEANHYFLMASDGFTEAIDRETFLRGSLYMDEHGGYGISFEGMDGINPIKNIISIEISD